MAEATRKGVALKVLDKGDRRRLADGRNAWRKMTPEQRREFTEWQTAERLEVAHVVSVRCGACGSAEVQHAFWVDPNTMEVGDEFGTWNYDDNAWCGKCEGHGTLEFVE